MPPTYADADACLAYTEGLTIADPDAFDRLIERAESDVDRCLGLIARDEDSATARKLNPDDLTATQVLQLSRATCAQVEYRLTMGEDYFIRPQYESVAGPDYTVTGKLPMIGPKVWAELEGSDLLRLTDTWRRSAVGTAIGGDRTAPPWADFVRNLD